MYPTPTNGNLKICNLRYVREGELNYFSEQTDNIFIDAVNKKIRWAVKS